MGWDAVTRGRHSAISSKWMPSTSCWPRWSAMARQQQVPADLPGEAIQDLNINPDKHNPWYV